MSIVTEEVGNIFNAPPRSILIHACNTQGSWGAGVALSFKKRYPNAYAIYNSHCKLPPPPIPSLAGTCLLIEPQVGDAKEHYIACLFTSPKYGRAKSPADKILDYTRSAIEDLEAQLGAIRNGGDAGKIGELWAVRINSGKFGVKWERSKEVLEAGGLSIKVMAPASDCKAGPTTPVALNAQKGVKRASSEADMTDTQRRKNVTRVKDANRKDSQQAKIE